MILKVILIICLILKVMLIETSNEKFKEIVLQSMKQIGVHDPTENEITELSCLLYYFELFLQIYFLWYTDTIQCFKE